MLARYELTCVDGYRHTCLGDDVYVLDLILTSNGLLTSASDQSLSLFDIQRLSQGPVHKFRTDHGNLTATRPFTSQNAPVSHVCTAGANGSVSVWDTRLDPSQAQVLRIGITENPCGILSVAGSQDTITIAAGTELANHQASIVIWDVRSPATPKRQYNEIHSDDVTELKFHPTNPDLLLSGSTDGLVCVSDTRITDEDEVIIHTFKHSSVHRAGYLDNDAIFAASHDELFTVFNTREEDTEFLVKDLGDIRSYLGCQYLANISPKTDFSGAVVGVGFTSEEAFHLVHLGKGGGAHGWEFDKDTVVGLRGAHGSELVRDFCIMDEQQVVLTGGEDGCIKIWRPGS